MNNRVCNTCNWVHFSVTYDYAKAEVKGFNIYFNTLNKEEQSLLYGGKKSSLKSYKECSCCRESYKNFRDATNKDNEKSFGCTIQPIINYVSKK